jgi:acetyl esterase/lipase
MKTIALIPLVLVALSAHSPAAEPITLRLWPEAAPGAIGTQDNDIPTLTLHRPDPQQAQPTAVVVCPGGGYAGHAMDHEGRQIADWLNSLGITACVLKYRLGPRYHHPAMIDDAQRAVRIVRANAKPWNIAPDKVGIIGFSAGGHLASTAATLDPSPTGNIGDAISEQPSRPNFAILIYPVIAMATEYGHAGSRRNLLGENPDPKLVASLSTERRVTSDTPPCFLVHSGEDKAVPPENSLLFYQALRQAGVPAEMHIYERGPHGFGLGGNDAALSTWPTLCAQWLTTHGFLARSKAE